METNEMRGEAEIHQVEVPPSSVKLATETIQHNPIATGQPTAAEQKTLEDIGKQLKTQHKMRMNHQRFRSSSHTHSLIQHAPIRLHKGYVRGNGHNLIAVIVKVMRPGTPPDQFRLTDETMVFCTKCGGNLQEIKGQ